MLVRVDLDDRSYEDLVELAKQHDLKPEEFSKYAGWVLGVAICDRLSGRQCKWENMDETIEHIKYLMVQPVMGTA